MNLKGTTQFILAVRVNLSLSVINFTIFVYDSTNFWTGLGFLLGFVNRRSARPCSKKSKP